MAYVTLAGAILSRGRDRVIAAIGMVFLGEGAGAPKILGVLLVIAGVVVLNLDGAH
ncbi:DMT family transporter [Streptomyces platensis]